MATDLNRHIGVVGAGTMGAGIAEVALVQGYKVTLCDVQDEVLQRARASILRHLQRSVEKQRMTRDEMEQCLLRLVLAQEMEPLGHCALVIEAVPENLGLKTKVLNQLEQVCPEETVLATNTSSLSITVLAAALKHSERVVGLHFFNPAPVMKLVEVVKGEETAPSVVKRIIDFAEDFEKTAIVCQDTPGFVVNRVARNFYGESLFIVGEGAATYETVDRLVEEVGGFKMGPFRLMDLIGIDVNFDVTKSVYEAFHHELRFRPHLLQERKVLAGHLGRKSKRGFYRYDEHGNRVSDEPGRTAQASLSAAQVSTGSVPELKSMPELESQVSPGDAPILIGDTPLARELANRIRETYGTTGHALLFDGPPRPSDKGELTHRLALVAEFLRGHQTSTTVMVSVAGDESFQRDLLQVIEDEINPDSLILSSLAGPSATKQASWLRYSSRLRGFSALLCRRGEQEDGAQSRFGLSAAAEWSRPTQVAGAEHLHADAQNLHTTRLLQSLGLTPIEVRDGPGGITLRVLSMILNEAQGVIHEGTAVAGDIDLGMKLGTNYPAGPVEWLNALGVPSVWYTLWTLFNDLGDPRYRVSLGLQNAFWSGVSATNCGLTRQEVRHGDF